MLKSGSPNYDSIIYCTLTINLQTWGGLNGKDSVPGRTKDKREEDNPKISTGHPKTQITTAFVTDKDKSTNARNVSPNKEAEDDSVEPTSRLPNVQKRK